MKQGRTEFFGPIELAEYTSAQRVALTVPNGTLVYDTDQGEVYAFVGGAWEAVSGVGNYATANLTATFDRTHTWGTRSLTENFNNGAGSATSRVQSATGFTFLSTAPGAAQSFLQAGLGSVVLSGGTGANSVNVTAEAAGLNIAFAGTADLKLNGSAGTAGQVLQSAGPGAAPVWAASADTNYASTNLTATANRAHTWGAFSLAENFASGAISTSATLAFGGASWSVDNGAGQTSTMTIQPSLGGMRVIADNTISDLQAVFNYEGVNFVFSGGSDLKINSSAGTSGQVLTSQGAGVTPIWAAAPAGSNYANDDLTAGSTRTHTWGVNNLNENFTAGIHTRQYISGATTTVTEQATGLGLSYSNAGIVRNISVNSTSLALSGLSGGLGIQVGLSQTGMELNFTGTADLTLNGNPGTSGQVLTSQGDNAAPIWATPSTGVIRNESANYTAVAGDSSIRMATAAGNRSITLPTGLPDGTRIGIHKRDAANTLTIQGNGTSQIITTAGALAASENFTAQYTSIVYEYSLTGTYWFPVA